MEAELPGRGLMPTKEAWRRLPSLPPREDTRALSAVSHKLVLTQLYICLKLGLPSLQNCEDQLLLFKSQPFCGLFSQQPGQMAVPTYPALPVTVVVRFISAYFSSRKTLLLLFQAVGIYYALPSVYLFLLYIPSVLPCFQLVLFASCLQNVL